MKKEYKVKGMTCQGCRAHVEEALQSLPEIEQAHVNLENETASIAFYTEVKLSKLQDSIGQKYTISQSVKEETTAQVIINQEKTKNTISTTSTEKSKLQQLQPLFLIFIYLLATATLVNWKDFSFTQWMLDFMGIFFIVFSFFKFLDYKGFPSSFGMYDPLAKVIPVYAWIYPFLETALGLSFLFRFQVETSLWLTILILGITTVGVTQSLFSKKKIKCACLGTALNLPMTEATFIENSIMLLMAIAMLAKGIL